MQVVSLQEFKMLAQTGESISNSASYLLWVLTFVSIFSNFALDILWSAFQTLQIILVMPLLLILMPANVFVVFRRLTDVINLDILDKQ